MIGTTKRGTLFHVLLAALVAAACGSRDTPAASQLTAAELDADTGPCVCRLPQDEGLTCCRGGLVLACACNGGANWACNPVPTGRSCGTPGRPGPRR